MVGAQKSAKIRMGVSSAPVTVTKKLYRRMASLAWVSFSFCKKCSVILGRWKVSDTQIGFFPTNIA